MLIVSTGNAMDLPDGPGKPVVAKICAGSHAVSVAVSKRAAREEWERTVDQMLSRGASGTDEEIDLVIDYLTANFGPAKESAKKQDDLSQ